MTRLKYGQQEACNLCGQDIEWHGRKNGWIDRGGNRACVPFICKGEVIRPPATAKHKPPRVESDHAAELAGIRSVAHLI